MGKPPFSVDNGQLTVEWPYKWLRFQITGHSEPVTDVTGVGIPTVIEDGYFCYEMTFVKW